jgi:hypothetical protein
MISWWIPDFAESSMFINRINFPGETSRVLKLAVSTTAAAIS